MVSERFELARNFCNKLWNASRFSLMNLDGFDPGRVTDDELTVEDSWVLSRLNTVTQAVTDALAEYRFADAARVLYDFAWDEFCSFYVEMVKDAASQDDVGTACVAQRVLAHVLDTLLRLLHPMIPFLTEDVWQRLGEIAPQRGIDEPTPAAESVMLAPWPECDPRRQNAGDRGPIRPLPRSASRRPRHPRPAGRRAENAAGVLRPLRRRDRRTCSTRCSLISRRWPTPTLTAIGPDVTAPAFSANVTLSGMEVFVDLADLIDVPAEIARKKQEVEKLVGFIAAKEKKLTNANFVARAPADVVQKERDSLKDLQDQLAAAREVLERLEKKK